MERKTILAKYELVQISFNLFYLQYYSIGFQTLTISTEEMWIVNNNYKFGTSISLSGFRLSLLILKSSKTCKLRKGFKEEMLKDSWNFHIKWLLNKIGITDSIPAQLNLTYVGFDLKRTLYTAHPPIACRGKMVPARVWLKSFCLQVGWKLLKQG